MKVFWAAAAEQDRAEIIASIGRDNPSAALRMDVLFETAAGQLSEHPLSGQAGLVVGTRELIPHESYRLIYEVDRETVWILALVHTARTWPRRRQ